MFGVNRPKQTKVIERKPQFDATVWRHLGYARPPNHPTAQPPFANLITRIFVENLVKKLVYVFVFIPVSLHVRMLVLVSTT